MIWFFSSPFIAALLLIMTMSCSSPDIEIQQHRANKTIIRDPSATCGYLSWLLEQKTSGRWQKSLALTCRGHLPDKQGEMKVNFELCMFQDAGDKAESFGGLYKEQGKIHQLFPGDFISSNAWKKELRANKEIFQGNTSFNHCRDKAYCQDQENQHQIQISYDPFTRSVKFHGLLFYTFETKEIKGTALCDAPTDSDDDLIVD